MSRICKRYMIILCVLAAAMMLIGTACADESSFNMNCWLKTGSTATLYALRDPDGGITVGGAGNLETDFVEAGSIPAGTYVQISSNLDSYGLDKITYWSGGGTASGYVKSSCLVDAVGTVYLDDGNAVGVPEAMIGHTSAILSYLNSSYSATFTAIEGSSLIHVEYTEGKVDWKPITTERLAFTYGSDEQEITVQTLGSAYSMILQDGKLLAVPTVNIHWKSEMPEKKQLAIINSPKTGRASLHLKSSARSTIVTKLLDGRVVAVISSGKNYTKVWCDGYVGYVVTKHLDFCEHAVPGPSVKLSFITFRGKLKSNNEVNVRSAPKNTSRILGAYKAGTQVTLFSTTEDGEWCEIEVDGIHCYIHSEFVTAATDFGV